jgi:hypothetical protein
VTELERTDQVRLRTEKVDAMAPGVFYALSAQGQNDERGSWARELMAYVRELDKIQNHMMIMMRRHGIAAPSILKRTLKRASVTGNGALLEYGIGD